MRHPLLGLPLCAALAGCGLACSSSDDGLDPPVASGQPGTGGEGNSEVATGGFVANAGGTGGYVVDDGVGLTSPVFGSLDDLVGSGGGGGTLVACDYGAAPACDFTRVDGCCSPLDCSQAATNPDDTHGIEMCENLIACIQDHMDCSTADNPFCFLDANGEEDNNSPCAEEVYATSHREPDGPYPATLALMNCICGY